MACAKYHCLESINTDLTLMGILQLYSFDPRDEVFYFQIFFFHLLLQIDKNPKYFMKFSHCLYATEAHWFSPSPS